jgi:hypothetical protein
VQGFVYGNAQGFLLTNDPWVDLYGISLLTRQAASIAWKVPNNDFRRAFHVGVFARILFQ